MSPKMIEYSLSPYTRRRIKRFMRKYDLSQTEAIAVISCFPEMRGRPMRDKVLAGLRLSMCRTINRLPETKLRMLREVLLTDSAVEGEPET